MFNAGGPIHHSFQGFYYAFSNVFLSCRGNTFCFIVQSTSSYSQSSSLSSFKMRTATEHWCQIEMCNIAATCIHHQNQQQQQTNNSIHCVRWFVLRYLYCCRKKLKYFSKYFATSVCFVTFMLFLVTLFIILLSQFLFSFSMFSAIRSLSLSFVSVTSSVLRCRFCIRH